MVKFIVRRKQASYPKLKLPKVFRPLPPLPDPTTLPRKVFKFGRKNGLWAINDKFWDPDIDHDNAALNISPNEVTRDTAELWVLDSSQGGWDHPLHIHFEEGQIIRTNGIAVPAGQALPHRHLSAGQSVHELILRFRDFPLDGYQPLQRPGPRDQRRPRPLRHALPQCGARGHAMMTTWSIRPPK